jgi:hypothetical protein
MKKVFRYVKGQTASELLRVTDAQAVISCIWAGWKSDFFWPLARRFEVLGLVCVDGGWQFLLKRTTGTGSVSHEDA